MQAPLPVASYLFILRKHLWLVLGTVVAALAAGWAYANTARPVYRSVAVVQLQSSATASSADKTFVIREDPQFVSNQVYRIRTDPYLAGRVLRHLRGELEPDGGKPAPGAAGPGEPREPALPDPSVFRDLDPKALPGMVTVTPRPPTSYYEISVSGPDPAVNYAVANGYARVFSDVFREEQNRQYQGTLKDYVRRLDLRKKALEEANGAIRAFKERNATIDFEREGNADKDNAENLRRLLATEQSRGANLKRQLESVGQTLRAARLRIVGDPGTGFTLDPPLGEDPARDPRLDERVQSLDVVGQNEGVRRARSAIDDLEEEDRKLAKFREDTPERRAIRERIPELRKSLALNTEAALLKLAQDSAQSDLVAADWKKEIEAHESRAAAVAVARAGLEDLRKAAAVVQADVDGLTGLILETERQRQKSEDAGGSVRTYLFADPAEAELVAPRKPVIYLATLVAALLLAAGLAYVLEYLDDTVKTREDFDRLVRLPFLGYVPHLKEGDHGPRELVVARGKTGSPEVESFRAIRTGIQFSRPDREVRALLVTSAGPGEGKTTVSVNLACAFTGGRGRVLLVDADLRRARVHSALGIENVRGLTNVLVGECTLEAAIQRSSVEGLDVLSSGPIPPNPAEVLGSERMQEVLREASARYDRVVVDSPPIVAVTDPALLAKYVDAVFLVICIGKTSLRTLQRARETLSSVGSGIHGAILNNADVKVSGYAEYYGGYGYGYGYGERKRKGGGD